MKKLLITLAATMMVISLSGCSANTGYAELSNPDEVVMTVGGEDITTGQVYDLMSNENIVPIILTDVNEVIYENNVKLDEETIEDLEAMYQETVDMYGGEESFLLTLQQYGYPSIEAYKTEQYSAAKAAELVQLYVKDNLDKYTEEYAPKKIQLMGLDSTDRAEEAIVLLNSGSTFEETAEALEYVANIEPTVATNYSSDIPSVVLVSLAAVEVPGHLPTYFYDEENETYYVVNVVDTDVNNFTDEFAEMMAYDSSIETEVLVSYYESMEFVVYDQDLYEKIQAVYPDYLVQE